MLKKMQKCLNDRQRRLVEDNLGLVHAVLKRMRVKSDYEDMFGIGCIGLCVASLNWREDGLLFSTYAYHFVEHELINHFKHMQNSKRSGKAVKPFDDSDASLAQVDIGFEEIEAAQLKKSLEGSIEELIGKNDADVIRLLLHGSTPAQAAKALKISLSAVYKARERASQRMKSWINQ
jgi:RNA polymerase sigma factor (sigma-70 family)